MAGEQERMPERLVAAGALRTVPLAGELTSSLISRAADRYGLPAAGVLRLWTCRNYPARHVGGGARADSEVVLNATGGCAYLAVRGSAGGAGTRSARLHDIHYNPRNRCVSAGQCDRVRRRVRRRGSGAAIAPLFVGR